MNNAKRLLILGASDFQLPAIQKAKEMGLIVAVADMNPNAIGVSYADKFYCVSTIDEDGIIQDIRPDSYLFPKTIENAIFNCF